MSANHSEIGAGPHSNPFVGLGFLLLAIAYSFVQGTVMAVELPEITLALDISHDTAALAATIMTAISGATLIAIGREADRIGRRRMTLCGAVVVIASSVLAAVSWNGLSLVLARAVQGLGTAMLLTSIGLVAGLFDDERRRALAFGLLGASVGVGLAMAPLVATACLGLGSWRLSFWVNVPIFALAAIGIRRTVPESRNEKADSGRDLAGTILLVIGLVAGLFALTQGDLYGWWWSTSDTFMALRWPWPLSAVAGLLMLSASALCAFVWVERTRARRDLPVLIDPAVVHSAGFADRFLVSFLFVLGGYALQFLVPVLGRVVLREDHLEVALHTAAIGVGITAGGIAAAPLRVRVGVREVLLTGLTLAFITLALLTFLVSDTLGGIEFGAVLLVFGVGYGITYASSTEVALLGVPPDHVGLASAMFVAGRTCAMAIGAAALTAVMTPEAPRVVGVVAAAVVAEEVNAARLAFGISAAIVLTALLAAIALPRRS